LNFDDGDLEAAYETLNDEYEDSVAAAEAITDHIGSVESVAEALFDEWHDELDEHTSQSRRRDSANQLKADPVPIGQAAGFDASCGTQH